MMYDIGGRPIDIGKIVPCRYTKWEKWFAWYPVKVAVPIKLPELQHLDHLLFTKRVWLKTVWRRKNLSFNQWEYTLDDIFFQLSNYGK